MDSVAGLKIPEKVKQKIERAVKVVKSVAQDSEIFLFGSFAKGDWLEDSDIDLIVVSDKFKELDYISRIYLLKRHLWEGGISGVHIIALTKREFIERKERSVVIGDALTYAIKIT